MPSICTLQYSSRIIIISELQVICYFLIQSRALYINMYPIVVVVVVVVRHDRSYAACADLDLAQNSNF